MSSILVPHEASSAAVVRHRLSDELASQGVAGAAVDAAALVLSELVGNAVRHGAPLPGGGVRASWALRDDVLRVEVRDGGEGVPEQLPPTASVPGGGSVSDVERGRGLTIVGLLAGRWGTSRSGAAVTVWADLSIWPSARGGAPGVGSRPAWAT